MLVLGKLSKLPYTVSLCNFTLLGISFGMIFSGSVRLPAQS